MLAARWQLLFNSPLQDVEWKNVDRIWLRTRLRRRPEPGAQQEMAEKWFRSALRRQNHRGRPGQATCRARSSYHGICPKGASNLPYQTQIPGGHHLGTRRLRGQPSNKKTAA